MVTATSITREAPFLEDFRRRLLQGGFDLTKQAQPGTTPREIAGLDALQTGACLLYTSPSPRDRQKSRMPSSA